MKKRILILGATSAIAVEVARQYALAGYDLVFSGRDLSSLERLAADFQIRYQIQASCFSFHAEDWEEHARFLDKVLEKTGGLDGVLLAFGSLGEHALALKDFSEAKKMIDCNFVGACSICHHLANYFVERGRGFIAAISSVAGDRGRQSNYVYGAAKGGFSIFLQGLRNRLHPLGVDVITIKPGFIDTAMTYGLEKVPFVSSPESIAPQIYRAIQKGKDVVYAPPFWRYVMGIIKLIPERIFKRLKL